MKKTVRQLLTELKSGGKKTAAFHLKDAKRAIDAIGIDMNREKWDIMSLVKGMNVESEHGNVDKDTDVVPDKNGHDDPIYFAKIAIAHLRELSDYYERLKKVEESKIKATASASEMRKWSDEKVQELRLRNKRLKKKLAADKGDDSDKEKKSDKAKSGLGDNVDVRA